MFCLNDLMVIFLVHQLDTLIQSLFIHSGHEPYETNPKAKKSRILLMRMTSRQNNELCTHFQVELFDTVNKVYSHDCQFYIRTWKQTNKQTNKTTEDSQVYQQAEEVAKNTVVIFRKNDFLFCQSSVVLWFLGVVMKATGQYCRCCIHCVCMSNGKCTFFFLFCHITDKSRQTLNEQRMKPQRRMHKHLHSHTHTHTHTHN